MIKKLSDYKNRGFKGPDDSLEISLFENGIIWGKNVLCNESEYLFVFCINEGESEEKLLFDYCYLSHDDLKDMFNSWAKKENIEFFTGEKFDEWIENFPNNVFDMVQYYGRLNVLISDCFSDGFKIEKD